MLETEDAPTHGCAGGAGALLPGRGVLPEGGRGSLRDGVLSRFLRSRVLKGEDEPQNSHRCLGALKATPKNPHFGVWWVLGRAEANSLGETEVMAALSL